MGRRGMGGGPLFLVISAKLSSSLPLSHVRLLGFLMRSNASSLDEIAAEHPRKRLQSIMVRMKMEHGGLVSDSAAAASSFDVQPLRPPDKFHLLPHQELWLAVLVLSFVSPFSCSTSLTEGCREYFHHECHV
eukprot:166324-Hanusia_phi.AAC.3